ncbi:MAG: DUF4886 domain-containing protein [Bacteroidales bacterium]|nr:DUF4886 domain-containing protein [Bacteroidales bacterium]
MKRQAYLLLPVLFLLIGTGCNRPAVSLRQDILFHAADIRTRTAFAEPDEDRYPALWTDDDRAVRISLNGTPGADAPVHASGDGQSAWFEASFTAEPSEPCTFYALSPATAFRSRSADGWDYEVPSVQNPSAGSVDPAAMVLSATSTPTEGLPAEVSLQFHHLTAYGLLTLNGLNTDLQSVTIDLGPDASLTVNTASPRQIWFGMKPADLSGREVTFTAKTAAGTYRRCVTLPEGRRMVAGQVARFTVDMTQAAFEPDTRSISILAIGNSFSIDAMEYLYGYLRQAGYGDIFLGNLYIGGCTLQTHAGHITGNDNAYQYYTNSTGTWTSVSGGNIATALKSRHWDYVSMQQASGSSGMADSYEPYLSTVVEAVKEHCPDAKRMWHMTWAYQANSNHSEFGKYGCVQIRMYQAILNAVRTQVLARGDFDCIIPCGTAIQNLRTSFIGDTVTRDGYHMSYNIGRVATALMWLKQICACPLDGIDAKAAGYSLTDRQAAAIKDAVEKAYAQPLAVTESADPPVRIRNVSDPSLKEVLAAAGYEPASYRELSYPIIPYAFYNSTAGSGLTSKAGGSTASNINQFSTTEFFSREDIPVGSVLVLKNGYQYRPEGWTRLSAKNASAARPANVTTQVVEVTEGWWSGWAYRAFNLAEKGNPGLTEERMEALRSCLSIFVPAD